MTGINKPTVTKPTVLSRQDMPPPGGYPPVDTKRRIGPRGPSGALIWGVIMLGTIYGFYVTGYTNSERRRIADERASTRLNYMPYLVAEQDRVKADRLSKRLQQEAEIMRNRPDWVVDGPPQKPVKKYPHESW